MFSGKTEELIRRLRRAQIARRRVQFSPKIDERYSEINVSADAPKIGSRRSADEILKIDWRAEVIGVDEAQFFDTAGAGVQSIGNLQACCCRRSDKDYLRKPSIMLN
jgi:thymidine kinase